MFYECKRAKKNQKNLTFGYLSFSALIKFIICGLFLLSFVSAELPKVERTLSILKPDAVEQNLIGNILSRFEKGGLKIVAAKMVRLSKQEAQAFYEVHKDKPFYDELVDFMSSGPILVSVLEGEGAIAKNREIMGGTDPQKALSGTIRKDFAQSIGRNAVHGSDSAETAKREIDFFFKNDEICER